MQITMSDLTVDFSHIDRGSLLEDWVWLIGPSRLPILVTAAGDVFVQDADDGSVHFLDVQAGGFSPVADSADDLRQLLGDTGFVRDYCAVDMVADLISRGRPLAAGQVYDLVKPLALGGDYEFDNIMPMDMAVHFSILGQINEQVSRLPPGTKIDGARLER